ncbi:4-diphosphocytidyl-2C-methyl-D-erythritol kinase [Hwanghaeella grinnelliae]|uniref:4-diphosphocytidyl-2C-methyl-D-erythritol kinase n=1 Tax=Hwanghaeella grinnelliae TaxID=2500179 RepID=A0A3S2VL58_9PROT|nr:molybdopterin-binding/glycosyltransferase family 2 protein [Hwanghaeella grinnelliae]RVU34778.1 4-diphosphocytidyl-2C-methyl-D-erythritol kinase [Hwanghaeella grinnelliae]
MRFGDISIDKALGSILVHSTRAGSKRLKKGRILAQSDLDALREAGIASVIVVTLDADDVHEDLAAKRIAEAAAGPGGFEAGSAQSISAPFTGRVNLIAEAAGIAKIDTTAVDMLNLVDEAITIATVPPFAVVQPGQMVATIKIIPFAAPEDLVARCEDIARQASPMIAVAPFAAKRTAFIQTRLKDTKESVLDKTTAVMTARLEKVGASLAGEVRVPHEVSVLAQAITDLAAKETPDLIFIAGASAITDRRDVIPSAIEQAGGTVDHFGMPVDPGNLLLFGNLSGVPVVGMPGCARSPKLNGFDWVLERLAADIPVTRADIMKMGAGGLLKEIETRPQPRSAPSAPQSPAPQVPRAPRIAAILLAAGRSTRMGDRNKLLADVDGRPMVRRVAETLAASKVIGITAVLGHEADTVRGALGDLSVNFVDNPDFAQGLSTSVKAGVSMLPEDCDGFIVCLGDMPTVRTADIDRLIAAFNPVEGRAICMPVHHGKRGNPVLFARRLAAEMAALEGDTGAKRLIGAHEDEVCEVETDSGVLLDIDTPDALSRFTSSQFKDA